MKSIIIGMACFFFLFSLCMYTIALVCYGLTKKDRFVMASCFVRRTDSEILLLEGKDNYFAICNNVSNNDYIKVIFFPWMCHAHYHREGFNGAIYHAHYHREGFNGAIYHNGMRNLFVRCVTEMSA